MPCRTTIERHIDKQIKEDIASTSVGTREAVRKSAQKLSEKYKVKGSFRPWEYQSGVYRVAFVDRFLPDLIEKEYIKRYITENELKKKSIEEHGEIPLAENEIKLGTDKVFAENPELAEIGTKQQYSQYLDAIFPDSKMKDIVYRGDGVRLNKAINSTFGTGYYFTPKKSYAENFAEIAASRDKGYSLYTSLINLKNPLVYNETIKNYKVERSRLGKAKDKYKEYALNKLKNSEDIPFLANLVNNENTTPLYKYKNGKYFTSRSREVSVEEIKQNIDLQVARSVDDSVSVTTDKSDLENINDQLTKNNDGVIVNIQEKYEDIKNEYIVFEPEQIHILGSKQDIEGFKEFVSKEQPRPTKEKEIADPVTGQLSFTDHSFHNGKELTKDGKSIDQVQSQLYTEKFEEYFPDYSYYTKEDREFFIEELLGGKIEITCKI